MMNPVLTALIPTTYRQSDLAYRLGLLREFLEFCFFTQQRPAIDAEAINAFASSAAHDARDISFLRAIPTDLFASFASGTFHTVLDQALVEAKMLPTVRLTVALVLPTEEVVVLGQWARGVIGPQVMLEFSVDPEIGAGCQVLWLDTIHDYSLEQQLQVQEGMLQAQLPPLLATSKAR